MGVHDPGVHALAAGRAVDVHGVAGQHDRPAPVDVGGAPLAPEGGQPGRVGHGHRLRCPLADEPPDLLQRRRLPVTLPREGEDHPPQVLTHRHADQRPAIVPEERVHLVLGPVPVQVDVGEQPVLNVRMPLEVQAKLTAHPAVGAVGADDVVGGDGPRAAPRLGDRGGDTAGIHPEAAEFGPLLDAAAELADPLAEDGLGHVLRDVEHEAESRPVTGQFQTDQGLAVGVHVEAAHHLAVLDEPLGQAHHVEHFERARVEGQGAGLQHHPVALVDNAGPDAAGQQLTRQHEPSRPGAHDQYLAIACHDRKPGSGPVAGASEELPRTYVSLATSPDS